MNKKLIYTSGPITIKVTGVMANIEEEGDNLFNQDMGIVSSARVSTGREAKKEGGEGLIGSLYRDRHETPFEGGSMFRFLVETPICMAQPFFQAPYVHNEHSGRYSVIDGEFYTPAWARGNPDIFSLFKEAEMDSQKIYKELLGMEIAKEHARFALLFRFTTKFYWTIALRHLQEILSLEPHRNAPEEFWHAMHDILPAVIQEFAPAAYEKMQEHERFIHTHWHEGLLRHPVGFYENELLKDYERVEKIENIGDIHLLYHKKARPELFRLATQTKLNPARGFGHVDMSFHINEPIFVHRQWVRHRYGTWSEIPPNFDVVVQENDFYIPHQFRVQKGKQMQYWYEDAPPELNIKAQEMLQGLIQRSCERYWILRKKFNIPAEEAAMNLPYVFRIHTLWTANLESLMNYFSLRCDTHAQWETRKYAEVVYRWFKNAYPIADDIFLKNLNFGKNDELFK